MLNKKVICHDINDKEYEVDSSELKFRPSVYGVIIKDDKILLSGQWDGYDFPGGGVEIEETVEEALLREVKEETGLDVEKKEVVHCETSFYKTTKGQCVNSVLVYFLCEITGGEISTEFFSESEKEYANAAEWIDIKDVEKIKFYNSIDSLEIIRKAEDILKDNR
ncbi:MAG: NUDIX domain-containing protein [Candidatus Pacebacteria bacterium]|nr:NUDIX domain-containing protein [Candidatus Paceibacterota bacterium]